MSRKGEPILDCCGGLKGRCTSRKEYDDGEEVEEGEEEERESKTRQRMKCFTFQHVCVTIMSFTY